jgi:hypothetical protein
MFYNCFEQLSREPLMVQREIFNIFYCSVSISIFFISEKTKKELKEEEEAEKEKRVPLSLEEMIAKRKAEQEALSKPKFLTKEERAAEAIKRRQVQIDEKRKGQEEERKKQQEFMRAAKEADLHTGFINSYRREREMRERERERERERDKDRRDLKRGEGNEGRNDRDREREDEAIKVRHSSLKIILEILVNKVHQWFSIMNDTLYWRFL